MTQLWLPPNQTPPSPRLQAFRSLTFIDESGQLRPCQGEVAVLGALTIPDNDGERTALRNLVQDILTRALIRSGPMKRGIKAKDFDEDELNLVADTIREHVWLVGPLDVTLEADTLSSFQGVLARIGELFREKRGDLLDYKRDDGRLARYEEQHRQVTAGHPVYLPLLFETFLNTARLFKKKGIFPVGVHAYLDTKLPAASREFLDFWLRFPFFCEFAEAFQDHLGALMGVDPAPGWKCEVTSDDVEPGLKIADVIAFVGGEIARAKAGLPNGGRDPAIYQRVWERMSVEWKRP